MMLKFYIFAIFLSGMKSLLAVWQMIYRITHIYLPLQAIFLCHILPYIHPSPFIQFTFCRKSIYFSDGSWSKFTWIKHERDFTFYYLSEMWHLWMTIFSHLSWFWVKTCQFQCEFVMKLRESVLNGNSQHRTEVKHDCVQGWKLLSCLNFL